MYVNLYVIQKAYNMKYNAKIILEKRKDKDGALIEENVPIIAQVTFSGTRLFYFTGFRIDAVNFDAEKQQATKNSTGKEGTRPAQYNVINQRLKAIKAALELFFQSKDKATSQEVRILLNSVCNKANEPQQNDVVDFYGMFEKFSQKSRFSAGRRRSIKSIINHWIAYETRRNIKVSFDNLTPELLTDFEGYLKNETDRPKGVNIISKIIGITRSFINDARKELRGKGIDIKNPFEFYSMPGEIYGRPFYITIEERNIIFHATMPTERLKRVRDIFIFQCLIGARVGDLCKLTKANIQDNILTYIPRKTKDGKPVTVNIPLHPQALEILSHYDLPDGKLLPFISDQRYNDYLKEVFAASGINRIVTRRNPTSGEEEQVRICDVVSSHMARRAFIGNLYGKIDSGIIASMSGHTANSRAFSRYYNVGSNLQKKAINLL